MSTADAAKMLLGISAADKNFEARFLQEELLLAKESDAPKRILQTFQDLRS